MPDGRHGVSRPDRPRPVRRRPADRHLARAIGTYLSRAECIAEALATATYRFAWVDATHARLTATDGGSVVLPIGLALQAAPQQVVTALAVIDRTSGEWNLRGTITLLDKSGSCVARVDAGKVESWRR